jgi:hypothetical protein
MSSLNRAFFAGWDRRHDWPHGVEFFRPAAPEGGVVRAWFPAGPVVPAARLVATQLRELRASAPGAIFVPGPRGHTTQADHFVIYSLRDPDPAVPIERRVGLVYTDRLMAGVDGLFKRAEAALFVPFVDGLTRDFPLRDGGRVRFRRYPHHRPAGWATRTRDLTTYLVAPRAQALVEVLPAQPLAADSIATRYLYEDVNLSPQPDLVERRHQTPAGLSGTLVLSEASAATGMRVGEVLLSDDAFNYVLRYRAEGRAYEQHRAEFLRVVDSVQPIPRMTEVAPLAAAPTQYWTE